jgi:putative endonuclease
MTSRNAVTTDAARARRVGRERAGRLAERIAAVALRLKGYRILARRVRTRVGELDLIAVRGRRLAFVEVKQRADLASATASLTARQTGRMHTAADAWLARHARYRDHELGFDAVFVRPWRWPSHAVDALQPLMARPPWRGS